MHIYIYLHSQYLNIHIVNIEKMADIEEKEDIKVTSIRLSSDSYFALKRLCNRYHQNTGEFITMSEFIENKLLKPHIQASTEETSLI